jgi:hypothetical protein
MDFFAIVGDACFAQLQRFTSMTWIVICCLAICSACQCEDAPIDVARIKKLATALSADDYHTRESAMQSLLTTGDSAWSCIEPLLDSDDLEARTRAMQLAWHFAIESTPGGRRRVQNLLKELESEDALERACAADKLAAMGRTGLRALRKQVSGAGAIPHVTLSLERQVYAAGDDIKAVVELSNRSETPFWITTESYFADIDGWRSETFGEERPLECIAFHRAGGRPRGPQCPKYVNPIFYWRPVTAQSKPATFAKSYWAYKAGIHEVVCRAWLPEPTDIEAGIVEALAVDFEKVKEDLAAEGQRFREHRAFQYRLEMNASWNAREREVSTTKKIYVLPSLAAANKDESLQFDVQTETTGTTLHATAILTSLKKDKDIPLEENLTRYSWYVILDEKGVPLKWGSWNSVREGEAAKTFSRGALKPEKTVEWKWAVSLPNKSCSAIFCCDINLEEDLNIMSMEFRNQIREYVVRVDDIRAKRPK